jgi:hypothetical protein
MSLVWKFMSGVCVGVAGYCSLRHDPYNEKCFFELSAIFALWAILAQLHQLAPTQRDEG